MLPQVTPDGGATDGGYAMGEQDVPSCDDGSGGGGGDGSDEGAAEEGQVRGCAHARKRGVAIGWWW